MRPGTTIRKILFISLWLAIGGGMFTLLMAAISKKNKGTCRDYLVTIRGEENDMFMKKEDIVHLMEELVNGPVKGQAVASFDLRSLEKKLEQNTWIDQAELYFDSRDVLHVTVSEKLPVARVFSSGGRSFYVDSTGHTIPLSPEKSARVPVFTGFPHRAKFSDRDSILLREIGQAGNYILRHPFWNAQVSQIDILPDRTLELIPLVGDHRVKLGSGSDIEAKLGRLYIFYRQVISKTGFNAYRTIDVQYRGQVIASRQSGQTKVDSIQLRKNVEKLLRKEREAKRDTISNTQVQKTDMKDPDPNPVKTTSVSPEGEKKEDEGKRTPKAVMPKRNADGPQSNINN